MPAPHQLERLAVVMAPGRHLAETEWRQFFAGNLAQDRVRAAVRHLLACCSGCTRLAAGAAGRSATAAGPVAADVASRSAAELTNLDARAGRPGGPAGEGRRDGTDRLLQQALERRHGREQWDLLRVLPPAERMRWVEANPALATSGLCERLIEECGVACNSRPRAAIELGELAVAVAFRLRDGCYPRRLIADLRGRAQACLAGARRVAGDLDGAWEALERCEDELDRGSGDPLEIAILHRSTGDLLLDLWRLEDAYDAYALAADIYAEVDDADQHAQVLVQLALAKGPREPESAIGLLEAALAEMAPHPDRRIELRALHSKTWLLNDLGRPDEAATLLARTRRLYQRLGDPATLARLHWLEARIAHRLGRSGDAELVLRRLWHRLHDLELPLDLCLLSADLVEVYAAQGKAREALPLARTFYPMLKRYGREEHAAAWRDRFGWQEA
jgi:tetratricopeptide (TPR) repeat protein